MTYFIGIDIAKYKHDCFIMDHNGEVIFESFTFSNDKTGFNQFYSILCTLNPYQEKRIGFEATGHYGMNLKVFLEDKNLSYMEINPILIKEFSKATTLRRTKTDKKDASLIAQYLFLKGIEKEIESYESALKRFDIKLTELKNNGWDEEAALEFLFTYVDELEKIVSCPEEKIEHYLDGRGDEFNQMFLLSDNSKGSIVSMTTSQVASLLNSVDKE